MTSPRISVVVPFYNNEDLLAECLDSIAAQTFRDLQVIMVDDGSTDNGAQIARARAASDPRFTLISVANGGPGYARNHGVEHATGEFLAFVDGDDMLPPGAYELLLHTLERSGSDFVSGNVSRIGPGGVHQSALHARAVKRRQIGTHVSATPRLLYDISVFNKLFRKAFWDAHALSFPEGMLWEDLQLMTKAHVLARAVDVVPECVYYWRERDKGQLSITQRRTDIGNLRDRVAALLAIDRFLAGHASAKLLGKHQQKALRNDLWLYVRDLHKASDAYRGEFIDLAGEYLDQVRPRVLRTLPATHKLAYHLIRARALPRLIEFVSWLDDQPVHTIPVIRARGRLVADLPLRDDPSAPVPRSVFRPHWRDLDPAVRVDDISWRGDRLVISGLAYVPSIDITERRHTSKIVMLRPTGAAPPIVLPARSFPHPEATALSGQERYSYAWAGFRCEISPRWFRLAGRWVTGDWEAYILVRGHGVWRPARIHTPRPGKAERPELRQVAHGLRFGARWVGLNLHVGVWRIDAVAARHVLVGGGTAADGVPPVDRTVEIDVDLTEPAAERSAAPAELVLVRQGGAATLTFPTVGVTAGGRPRLRARVPVAALTRSWTVPGTAGDGAAGAVAAASDTDSGGDTAVAWDVYLGRPGRPRARVAFPDGSDEGRYLLGGTEIIVGRGRQGDLEIIRRVPHPVIEQHGWLADGRLRLAGSYLGAGLSADADTAADADAGQRAGVLEAVLRRRGSSDRHVVAARVDGDRFTIEVDVGRMPVFGDALPLRSGDWDIFLRPAAAPPRAGASPRSPTMLRAKYDHARLAVVTEERVEIGPNVYWLSTMGYDDPVISVRPKLRLSEQGRFNQRVLRRAYYPLKLRAPLRDAVVFVSWKGKQCADNPRAIADELRRRGDDREHIWVVTDWSIPAPPGSTVVRYGTEEYYDALARSAYLVSNDDMQPPYRKRDGQFYLQTWHGTMLKRIGFDIERPQFISGAAYFDRLAEDVSKWDLLLSPNPFSTPIMRRAFRYEGEVAETGYPRNDLLSHAGDPRIAARVRQRLGLPDGKRVVLYAPTWRDNQVLASGTRYRFDLRLDLDRARRALGRDHVLLLRGHHQMADDVPTDAAGGFAVNVTAYPDISELYLVSDVLVTDYSSAMFDYAVTGRPMIFYTYDLAEYRDQLRGFYFDFEAEAPGPLLATSDDVLAAIRDIDAVATDHRAAYRAFAAKFCPLDDGKAAARVCDRVFGS